LQKDVAFQPFSGGNPGDMVSVNTLHFSSWVLNLAFLPAKPARLVFSSGLANVFCSVPDPCMDWAKSLHENDYYFGGIPTFDMFQ